MNKELRLKIFRKASLCRFFEEKVYEMLEKKIITIPVYLSTGQEFISASIASMCEEMNIKPLIFVQHRNHSTYLSFGGDPIELIRKLLGKSCPMEGSASLQCPEINMFGHDGLLGSQVPIAVGACFASQQPTLCFMGDAAVEEDYVLSSLGWASLKHLPILFIVEDNNLSILTEKKVRRNWSISNVAKGFELLTDNITDDPAIIETKKHLFCKSPILLNINTNRMYWHAGAGKDGNVFDRYKRELNDYDISTEARIIDQEMKEYVENIWKQELSK